MVLGRPKELTRLVAVDFCEAECAHNPPDLGEPANPGLLGLRPDLRSCVLASQPKELAAVSAVERARPFVSSFASESGPDTTIVSGDRVRCADAIQALVVVFPPVSSTVDALVVNY